MLYIYKCLTFVGKSIISFSILKHVEVFNIFKICLCAYDFSNYQELSHMAEYKWFYICPKCKHLQILNIYKYSTFVNVQNLEPRKLFKLWTFLSFLSRFLFLLFSFILLLGGGAETKSFLAQNRRQKKIMPCLAHQISFLLPQRQQRIDRPFLGVWAGMKSGWTKISNNKPQQHLE